MTVAMNCSDIERHIRSVLDDLLSEDEYQSAHAHLAGCSKCKRYVGAIGSFSYMLKELGEVEVPHGLADSILFSLKTQPAEVKTPAARSKKILIAGVLVTIVIGVSVYFGFRYFKMRHSSAQEGQMPTVSSAEVIQKEKPPSDEEAAMLFDQLKAISTSLGGSEEGAQEKKAEESSQDTGKENAEESIPAEKQDALVTPAPSPDQMTTAKGTASFHWHFSDSEGGGSQKMLEILTRLGAQFDYNSSELMVLALSPPQFQQFVQEMEQAAPRTLPTKTIDFQKLSSAAQKILLSISVKKNETAESHALHWHLRIPQENEFRLFEVFRQMDLVLDYDSPELVALTISSTRVEELIKKIRSIEGLSGNFTSPSSSQMMFSSYPIQVSIYLAED